MKLDEYTEKVIRVYERTINRLLDDFHAGFRITETTHGYPGGIASSSYQILINDVPVELGDSSSPLANPSFKNTLSSGDKSTLALAFFLARLEHDPEKANQVAVFDDPFNSQDGFRKEQTVQKIMKYGDLCRQVIVLSHDQVFLKRIWDRLTARASERKCLRLDRIGVRDTTISEWDIEETTQPEFAANRKALAAYYNAGEGVPREIVRKLRPVLETFCRTIRPEEFASEMLGGIVRRVRDAGPSHVFYNVVDNMDEINVYTRRYHHGDNPNADQEQISDGELHGFAKKTLAIIGCC